MKKIFLLMVFCFVFIVFSMSANAQLEDFKTKPISEDELRQKYSSMDISCSDTFNLHKFNFENITSFSVSEQGLIAVGIEGTWVPFINFFPDDYVLIIDNTGNILNCIYYTYPHSDTIFVDWHNDNVLIIERRGGVIIEISPDGEIIEYYDITAEENDDVRFRSKPPMKISINDNTYELKRGKLLNSGKHTTLYKNSQTVLFNLQDYKGNSQYIAVFVIIGIVIVEAVVIIRRTISKKRKRTS